MESLFQIAKIALQHVRMATVRKHRRRICASGSLWSAMFCYSIYHQNKTGERSPDNKFMSDCRAQLLMMTILAAAVAGPSEAANNDDFRTLLTQMLSLGAALSEVDPLLLSPDASTGLIQVKSDLSAAARRLDMLTSRSDFVLTEFDAKTYDQLASALVETRQVCESSASLRLERLNSQLFATASTFAKLPHPATSWYILAISPSHITAGISHPVINVVALTPDPSDTLPLGITIQGTSPETSHDGPGLWHFTLPDTQIHQTSTTIQLDFPISIRRMLLFSMQSLISARLYIDPQPFFTIEVEPRTDSPKAWATVDAKSEFITRADSSHQTVSTVVTAPQLFAQLVGDDTAYFADSAKFTNAHASIVPGGKPCGDCPEPQASYNVSADGTQMTVSLAAISCAAHFVAKLAPQLGYFCGGGGSNIEVRVQPSFLVRRRNVQDEVVLPTKTIHLNRANTDNSIVLASNWSSVKLTSSYRDADVQRKEEVILDHSHLTDRTAGLDRSWHARIEENALVLTGD